MPSLTIGMPIYNGADKLPRSLDRLLGQTLSDFELILHDNASVDGTADICADYVRRDPRVRYFRNSENLGWSENFRLVLHRASTPYFMWATHDDIWEKNFAEANVRLLEQHPEAVCSVGKVVYFTPHGGSVIAPDTGPISGTAAQRLGRFLAELTSVGRLYGVYRTTVLQKSFPEPLHIFGTDWLVVARTMLHGDHLECDEILLWREHQSQEHYSRNFGKIDRFVPTRMDWLFPLRRFNEELRKSVPREVWREIRPQLAYLNLRHTIGMREYSMPYLRPLTRPVRRLAASLLHDRWREGY